MTVLSGAPPERGRGERVQRAGREAEICRCARRVEEAAIVAAHAAPFDCRMCRTAWPPARRRPPAARPGDAAPAGGNATPCAPLRTPPRDGLDTGRLNEPYPGVARSLAGSPGRSVMVIAMPPDTAPPMPSNRVLAGGKGSPSASRHAGACVRPKARDHAQPPAGHNRFRSVDQSLQGMRTWLHPLLCASRTRFPGLSPELDFETRSVARSGVPERCCGERRRHGWVPTPVTGPRQRNGMEKPAFGRRRTSAIS